ncbi:hypothetical protein BGZ99_008422 [Dissophora globulifera]|uniref:F-box domain-containing protein n=1 Tax=Dissophora globulifera TaxID=979702 RepID=A0A9P6UZC6_9FUNG|nr:hypothetical protein BGZ99_008422 [Dissophora globulifera]
MATPNRHHAAETTPIEQEDPSLHDQLAEAHGEQVTDVTSDQEDEFEGGDDHNDEDEDEDEEEDEDYYDPQDDIAYYHDQKLRIEESWLEWERQTSVNNRQNSGGSHHYHILQKPGSIKRRERRQRYAQRTSSASSSNTGTGSTAGASASATTSAAAAAGGGGASTADLDSSRTSQSGKAKRVGGSYRPALASSIVHSYTNLTWEATQAAREKRLAAKMTSGGTGENIIRTLPVELLSHIVSHLEPRDLFNTSLVSRLFYHIVNADSCWKEAFMKFFGASIPFKRLDPKSWRGEYIKRTRLLRRWEKGRGSNILIDPKIGQISKLWAEADNRPNEGWFLAGGLAEGVVARCDPLSGKVQKDAVIRMVHLVNSEIAVMAMDRHRVLWGLTTGQVSLTTLAYAAAGQTFQTFVGFHHGPVSCVKLIPNHLGFVLTGGVDGIVKLWDVAKARCVRDFSTGSSVAANSRARIDHICCEPGSRIVAGTSTGSIFVWDVDVSAIIAPASAPVSGSSTPARSASSDNANGALGLTPSIATGTNQGGIEGVVDARVVLPRSVKLPEEFRGIGYLDVDFGMQRTGLILVQAVDATVMHLYSLETLAHLAILKSPAHFTPISAIHWDIPKYEKPMISASNSTRPDLAHGFHGRHEMPSLLASGDQSGNICLWYLTDILKRQAKQEKEWAQHPSQATRETMVLEPSCVLKGHDAKVTSLFVDKLVIVSGSADGWAKAWNPVNGQFISVLNTGYIRGREINDTNSSSVKCVVVNSLQCRGILSIGGLIRSWDFSPEANLAKDKYRKHMAKRPIHYSAGPKNKIQNDIRHSLEETVSLKRLQDQAKDRRQQLYRRYNNLEGLNMVDMTDEEVVEYVMMLSKEGDDQEAIQVAAEMQQIQDMEEELAIKQSLHQQDSLELNDGGEGSSSISTMSDAARSRHFYDDDVTEQELEEEEELVRRAIALSMLDVEESASGSADYHGDDHFHGYESDKDGDQDSLSHSYKPLEWEISHVVDVDDMDGDDLEDQRIVQAILQELEEEEEDNQGKSSDDGESSRDTQDRNATSAPDVEAAQRWPTIGASTGSSSSSVDGLAAKDKATGKKEMTWSMVARTQPESSSSSSSSHASWADQPGIIKQYPRSGSQEEIEDEDTQLARILSLSMVEK